MSITTERIDDNSVVRLQGQVTITHAAELKNALLEGLAARNDLRVEMETVEEIDITAMQLLWALGREAERTGIGAAIRASEDTILAARDAGFERFPGLLVEG